MDFRQRSYSGPGYKLLQVIKKGWGEGQSLDGGKGGRVINLSTQLRRGKEGGLKEEVLPAINPMRACPKFIRGGKKGVQGERKKSQISGIENRRAFVDY